MNPLSPQTAADPTPALAEEMASASRERGAKALPIVEFVRSLEVEPDQAGIEVGTGGGLFGTGVRSALGKVMRSIRHES